MEPVKPPRTQRYPQRERREANESPPSSFIVFIKEYIGRI